jgi:hypothetical protein
MSDRANRFASWARGQAVAHGFMPPNCSVIRPDVHVTSSHPVFGHCTFTQRVCLWAPQADLRIGGTACAEFGVVSEPYGFVGNEAQLTIAGQYGLRFDLLRDEGFRAPFARPFLWTVIDLGHASAVVQALLPDLPLGDLWGLAQSGQRLAVVDDEAARRALSRLVTELRNAGGGA